MKSPKRGLVRGRVLYTLLTRGGEYYTKEKWGRVSFRKVTGKYMVSKGCLVRFVMQPQAIRGDKSYLMRREEEDDSTNGNFLEKCKFWLQKRNFVPGFRQKRGESRELLLGLLFLIGFSSQ